VSQRRVRRSFQLVCVLLFALAVLALPTRAAASEYHGQVTFHGWPVPGATIKLTQATTTFSTVSDQGGLFTFSDLQDEPAKIVIEMQGFSAIAAEVTSSGDEDFRRVRYALPNEKPRVSILSSSYVLPQGTSELQTVQHSPGLEDLWQLNSEKPGPNIVNFDPANCPGKWLKVSAAEDGSFTVTNVGNGFSKHYPARPR